MLQMWLMGQYLRCYGCESFVIDGMFISSILVDP